MPRTGSLLERVRELLAKHRDHDAEHCSVLRSYVDAYVTMLKQTAAGVEAHAATLRRAREEATLALIHLQSEAERKNDHPAQRYVVAARVYLQGLESFIAGEGVGAQQLEQLRLDYEEIKGVIK